jgi:hypothetical protein
MGRFSFPLFAKSLKALHSGIPLRGAKRGLLLFINVLHIFPTETRTPRNGGQKTLNCGLKRGITRRPLMGTIAPLEVSGVGFRKRQKSRHL